MLKVYLTIFDGCNWTHCDIVKEFKNKKELNEYIKHRAAMMDDVSVNRIEKIEG